MALLLLVQLEALGVKTVQVVLVDLLVIVRLALLVIKVVRRSFLVSDRVAKLVIKVVQGSLLVFNRVAKLVMEAGTYVFESTIGYFEFIQNLASSHSLFLFSISIITTSYFSNAFEACQKLSVNVGNNSCNRAAGCRSCTEGKCLSHV